MHWARFAHDALATKDQVGKSAARRFRSAAASMLALVVDDALAVLQDSGQVLYRANRQTCLLAPRKSQVALSAHVRICPLAAISDG